MCSKDNREEQEELFMTCLSMKSKGEFVPHLIQKVCAFNKLRSKRVLPPMNFKFHGKGLQGKVHRKTV